MEALEDEDQVRMAAAGALRKFGHAGAVSSLIDVLDRALAEDELATASTAAAILGSLGPAAASAVPALSAALHHRFEREDVHLPLRLGTRYSHYVSQVALALGRIGAAAAPAVPALIDTARDFPEDHVRDSAWRALEQIGVRCPS